MFERKLIFQCIEEDFKITSESKGVTADEVMQHFIQFMVGVGYCRNSVHDSMCEIVEEHADYLKQCDNLKIGIPFDLE